MELRHLRYFVAVAEELHFGRAAIRLQISQPPLSQQIRRLEKELGVELFRRTKRDVQMTSAGKALLERARLLLVEVERSIEAARLAARGVIGRIEIGYVPTAEIRIIPRLLRAFRRRFPQVEVGLHLLPPAEQVEALKQSRIDVALTRLPLEDKGIRTERFFREGTLLAVSRKSPLAKAAAVSPERLEGIPILMFPRLASPALHDAIVGYFRSAGSTPKLTYAVSSIIGGLGLISAGMGVSIVPEAVKDIRFSGVAYRPLTPPAPYSDMGIARLREAPTALQDLFLKLMRHLYPKVRNATK